MKAALEMSKELESKEWQEQCSVLIAEVLERIRNETMSLILEVNEINGPQL